MSEEEDRRALEAEFERLAKPIDPEEWAESVARVKRREAEERRRLFGDREPFAVPDVEADS